LPSIRCLYKESLKSIRKKGTQPQVGEKIPKNEGRDAWSADAPQEHVAPAAREEKSWEEKFETHGHFEKCRSRLGKDAEGEKIVCVSPYPRSVAFFGGECVKKGKTLQEEREDSVD